MSFFKKIFSRKNDDVKADVQKQQEKSGQDLSFHIPGKQLPTPEDVMDLEDIWDVYQQERIRGKQQDFIPVLIYGNEDLLDTLQEEFKNGTAHLPLSPVADGKVWLNEQYQAYFSEDPEREHTLFSSDGRKSQGLHRFLSLQTALRFRKEMPLYLVEIPTVNPWEVFAWLPFGGWNDCPDSEDMMAVFQYWYEKYGAVPACIGSDTLECIVSKPVSEADAIALAKEQYAFCSDIVEQGMGSISALAEELKQSTIWYFWWD